MGRSPCCNKVGLNRGAWTALEDKKLADYIQVHGEGKWRQLPKNAGLERCGKSCRLRWLNYLRPDIKRGNISEDEEDLILRLHKLLGNRWSLIAGRIPGRTDNEIKNYWNTNLSKKAASSSSEARMTPKPQMTKANSYNAINEMAAIPNSDLPASSSRVFHTRATKCSKVVMQPPPPATNILINDSTQNIGWSCNYSDEPAEGMMTEFTDMMDDDDVGLGDFCLSDFLNSDFYGPSIDNKENEKDIGCSGALNWALDVDQDQVTQSTNACATGSNIEHNPELFSGFIDSYDNWDI